MQNVDSGKDAIDTADLIIPRVALMQGISPAVMAGEAENGHFFHTINEQDLGDSLELVCLLYRKQVTLWNPLHMGGGVIARASDGKTWDADFDVQIAPYKDFPKKLVNYKAKKGDHVGTANVPGSGLIAWGSADPENEDSGPAATVSHVFMFRALNYLGLGPFIIFLQRSAEPVAKQLLTKIRLDNAPIYGQVFSASKVTATNGAGQEYNQYKFTKNGYVQDEALFHQFQEEHNTFKTTSFRTNDEDALAEEANAGGAGGTAGGAAKSDSKDDTY